MKEDGKVLGPIGRFVNLHRASQEAARTWPSGLTEEEILAEQRDPGALPIDLRARFISVHLTMCGQGLKKGQKWVRGERVRVADSDDSRPIELITYGRFTREINPPSGFLMRQAESGYSFCLNESGKIEGNPYSIHDLIGKEKKEARFTLGGDFYVRGTSYQPVSEGKYRGSTPRQREMLETMYEILEMAGNKLPDNKILDRMREIVNAPYPLHGAYGTVFGMGNGGAPYGIGMGVGMTPV